MDTVEGPGVPNQPAQVEPFCPNEPCEVYGETGATLVVALFIFRTKPQQGWNHSAPGTFREGHCSACSTSPVTQFILSRSYTQSGCFALPYSHVLFLSHWRQPRLTVLQNYHSLTAPAANPCTKYLPTNPKKNITGTTVRMDAADI